jgi:predicted Zn-dependent protease
MSPWREVEIPKAAYTPPSHQVYRSSTAAFDRAMEAYRQDKFNEAAEQLAALSQLEVRNAGEVQFYFGVSLLLAGRPQEAIEPLTQAVQLTVGQQQQSSYYYWAVAFLKTNQPDRALAELSAVMAMEGEHQHLSSTAKQDFAGHPGCGDAEAGRARRVPGAEASGFGRARVDDDRI